MTKIERKREMWLAYYSIFAALFIQVLIDSVRIFFGSGVIGDALSGIVGLFASVIGMFVLGVYAWKGFSWSKNPQNIETNDEEKELLKQILAELRARKADSKTTKSEKK